MGNESSKVRPLKPLTVTLAEFIDENRPASVALYLKAAPRSLFADHPLYGWSPLTTAARYNLVDAGRELIHAGCSISRPDGSGHTPVSMAVERNSWAFLRMVGK